MLGSSARLNARISSRPAAPAWRGRNSFLASPIPCSPGDGATEVDGFLEDFGERVVNPPDFLGVALVTEEGRVQVAVAHVAEGADAQPVFFGGLVDEGDHGGQLAARTVTSSRMVVGKRGPGR